MVRLSASLPQREGEMRIKIDTTEWHKVKANKKEICVGMQKMYEAIAIETKEEAKKGSGLPSDWRNRILKEA